MYNFEFQTNHQPLWTANTEVDKNIEKFFEGFLKNGEIFTPACEMHDQEKCFSISLDVPGIKNEDVSIELKENQLYVSGERKKNLTTHNDSLIKSEKKYGKFVRIFNLPKNVKTDEIQARLEEGVLEIILPKEEKVLPRKISITKWNESDLKN